MTQIHSGETSWPRDCVARSVAARLHALKLASITFQELMLSRLVASLPVEVLNKVFHGEGPPQGQTSYHFWHKRYPFPIPCIDKRDPFTYHVKCLCYALLGLFTEWNDRFPYPSARSPKVWPPLINSHSFMQTLTSQKWRIVFSWLLIGLILHETMGINQKRSNFGAPCCNIPQPIKSLPFHKPEA